MYKFSILTGLMIGGMTTVGVIIAVNMIQPIHALDQDVFIYAFIAILICFSSAATIFLLAVDTLLLSHNLQTITRIQDRIKGLNGKR